MTRTLDGLLTDISLIRLRLVAGLTTRDADFVESDHPRDDDGQFAGSGSGASSGRAGAETFAASHGIYVEAGDSAGSSHVQAVQDAVASLPSSHKQALKGWVDIAVVGRITIAGRSSTGQPTTGTAEGSWRPNSPGKSFEGGQIKVAATVVVGGEERNTSNVSAVTTHEVGHALDSKIGQGSTSKAFQKTIPPTGQRGTEAEEDRGKYFHGSPREVWAECYAVEYGSSKGTYFHSMDRTRAKQVYSAPIAAMKKLLAAKGIE